MKSFLNRAWIAAVVFAAAFSANAQQLVIATGGAGNTYSKMFKELTAACAPQGLTLVEKNTGGSIDNVNMLRGNQVNGAFVQADVLFARANTEDMSMFKTLIALHPEEVHVLVSTEGKKVGGVMGIGSKIVVINTVSDLDGKVVAASGGSFLTAQVIRLQSEIKFDVVEVPNTKAGIQLLEEGKVDAVLAVGGQPLGDIASLSGGKFKLASFPDAVVAKLKNVYQPARVSYPKINQNGIPTVSVDALFVTREYKTDKYVTGLSALRSCSASKLDELKETLGNHPKWSSVSSDNKGKWAYLQLGK